MELLNDAPTGGLMVMAYHPGLSGCVEQLTRLADTRSIVALAGINEEKRNITLVATNGSLYRNAKISLATEDTFAHVNAADELIAYVSEDERHESAVRWAVLNCHDYTHVDILDALLKEKIEVLVVVSYNTATRLYWQYAIADVHRLYCYVVIANVAEQGGSGVFAPIRRLGGGKNAQYGAGGQMFGARGPGEFVVDIDLDIGGLRQFRRGFSAEGFDLLEKGAEQRPHYTPMVPPEHFMATFDEPPGARAQTCSVRDVPANWPGKSLRLAVGQLDHIGTEAYVASQYRIRNHDACPGFLDGLRAQFQELESRCKAGQRGAGSALLDMLVLPEVFIPRTFLHEIQEFSDRLGAVIIGGIDYPDGGESTNANECAILRPNLEPVLYRKITRSQYDARTENGRMPLNRGGELLRFVGADERGFGVLVCLLAAGRDFCVRHRQPGRPFKPGSRHVGAKAGRPWCAWYPVPSSHLKRQIGGSALRL